MARKSKTYLLSGSAHELNLRFYQAWDENYLLNKAATLAFAFENFSEFKPFAEQHGFDFENDEKRYLDAIRTEVYFSEIHQAEVLFALLAAAFQPLPHWLYLTTYRTEEIHLVVDLWLKRNIQRLTNNELRTPEEFVLWAIYSGYADSRPEATNRWETNLANILWILDQVGRRYSEAPEYNAYKHGLRILTGAASLSLSAEGRETPVFALGSKDSITFLETKSTDVGITVHETTKLISPEESYNYLYAMTRMMKAIKDTRLAKLSKQQGVELPTFVELDRDKIIGLRRFGRWSLTV